MILEYLQPDPNIWDGITVIVRAAYYLASLGAAGLAMFAIGFGHRQTQLERERLGRLMAFAVAAAIVLSLVAAVVRVQILSAGEIGNFGVWEAMFRSRIGDAFWIRTAGLLLILPLAFGARIGPALAGAGALLVVGSYAAMGHSTLYRPRQELVAVVVVHLACLAFWVGSLPPLRWAAERADRDAAALIADWSRVALVIVALLVTAGLIGATLLVRAPAQLLASWYGNAMIVKLLLVSAVMALAAWHKLALSPELDKAKPGAGKTLSRSILAEMALMALVFYAAAEMVSVHPHDLGHRIAP